jgi:5-methylcytosine-specific restriction endonuclease McrA
LTGRALVLNATSEALGVVASRRALILVLSERAAVVAVSGRVFHAQRASFPEPSVVRLENYVRVPRASHVAVTRRAIFARDGHRCQYCGAQAENIDHIIPRSRGGAHSWENVVAACRRCNTKKEDRLPEEVGYTLRRPPRAPVSRLWLLAVAGELQHDWEPFVYRELERVI